jgi:RecA-family ATPase
MAPVVEFDDEFASAPQWARMYRALGFQVVPAHLPHDGQWKRPLIDWLEFQDNLTPDSLFERWYGAAGEHVRRKNMGLICGAASGGLLVVDLDTQKELGAWAWWAALLEVHNNGLDVDTPRQRTGGGGLQILFRAPAGWTPPTFKAPSVGIDVRGQGGFMVAPPSLHSSGKHYEWEVGLEPWAVELAIAPDWLIEAIETLREEHGGQPSGPREHTPSEGATNAFGLDVDDREHKLLQAVWGAVVDLYRESPIPPPEAVQVAEIARIWANYELTTKSRLSGPQYAGKSKAELLELEGRGITELRQKWTYAMKRWDTKVKEAAAEARPSPPAAADAASDAGQASDEQPPALIQASSWRGDPPARDWVVEDWIVAGAVNSLYGDGGLGKTLLAQQLAYAVSVGGSWLGLPTRRGRVLGVFCEDDEAELQRRHGSIKAAMGYGIGNPFEDVWLWPRIGAENTLIGFARDGVPVLHPFHAELVRAVEELCPALLILDTLADVFAGNELDRPQVNYFAKRVLGGLVRSQKARGHSLTVLLLGHPSVTGMQAGGRGYSGSTAWNNAVRSRIYLSRPEDEDGDARLLTRGKANYASSGDETAIRLAFADGVLAAERVRDENDPVSRAIEYQIERAVREAWDERWQYVTQRGHRRNVYVALPAKLAALGYDRGAVRAVIRRMIEDQKLVVTRRGGRSGLNVAD